jgi:hypothetical protein
MPGQMGLLPGFLSFAVVTASAAPQSFIVPGHGRFELDVPVDWKLTMFPAADKNGPAFQLESPGGTPLVLLATPGVIPGGPKERAETLKRAPELILRYLQEVAVVDDLTIKEIAGTQCRVFYVSATNRAIDKPPLEGYEFLDQGIVEVGPIMISFTLLTNAKDALERATALDVLSSSRHVPLEAATPAATAAAAATRVALTATQVDQIIALTQANFWGNAKGRDGKALSPADEKEKHSLLIPRADAMRVAEEAHTYGLALWCGIDWRPTYLEYMQAERAKGWNEKQIAFVGMLFGAIQGKMLRLLEAETCTNEDKSAIQQALDAERIRLSNITKR